jgi:membrane associated rhomboid family serine protease
LLYHIASAATSTVLIALCCLLRNRLKGRTLTLLALEAVTVISIALTAHLGGFLSGVNT